MKYIQVILIIAFTSFDLGMGEIKSGVRKKRIMYGHPASKKDLDAYQGFRYYVFLTKAKMGEIDEDPKKITGFISWIRKFLHPERVNLEYHHCGGSLVAPKVVLTACHCLAIFNRYSTYDNYTYAWPLNVWEDRIYSHVGSNEASLMVDFLNPKHYVIQQTCRQLEFGLDFVTMDFGVILTKSSVVERAPKAPISYVPVYRAEDILNFYYKTIQQEFMCLLIGHGYYQLKYRQDKRGNQVPVAVPESSEMQNWGWRNVLNYIDCLSTTYPIDLRKIPKSPKRKPYYVFYNYTMDNTNVCLKAFTNAGKFDYNLGAGDSGGPIICNDVFYAVASMSDDNSPDIISYVTPIVHTMFISAAEYRDAFLQFTQYWDLYDDEFPDEPYRIPTYPALNPTPPPVDVRPLSRSSLQMCGHQLLALPLTIQCLTLFETLGLRMRY